MFGVILPLSEVGYKITVGVGATHVLIVDMGPVGNLCIRGWGGGTHIPIVLANSSRNSISSTLSWYSGRLISCR